jgi:type III secretory pathway component EscV
VKLKELIPTADQLKLVQGIEKQLLQRKSNGIIISGILALSGAGIQILIDIISNKFHIKDIFISIINFFKYLHLVSKGSAAAKNYVPVYELAGIFLLAAGIGIYLLFKKTRFLIKESEEPFRYTFWIEPFVPAKKDNDKKQPFSIDCDDSFYPDDTKLSDLLHHDLMERLNERINRFSLLKIESGNNSDSKTARSLSSHIHIEGHYTFRKEKHGEEKYFICVMPRVRIGPPENPAVLAKTVKYPVKIPTKDKWAKKDKAILDVQKYNQIVERAYSSVATEIYKQIESDVKEKISLFPTRYLRACALFHEAEDFKNSNTLDAYDRAIKLYREALRYFNISKIKWITQIFIRLRVLWRLKVKFVHMQARVQIGYASCMIYRRRISALSGRPVNPLFGIRPDLEKVQKNLEVLQEKITGIKGDNKSDYFNAFLSFPEDSWFRYRFWRPLQSLFERQRNLFFDAALILAFLNYELDAIEEAETELEKARSIAPQRSESNPLYLLTAGAIEPDIEREIRYFRLATESNPNFQIAQFLLSYYLERHFRSQNEINYERAKIVLEEYDKVLEINPGNIAALAAQGYIYWLLKDKNDEAKEKFKEGCDFKTIVCETFIGELNYGLARIAAEEGRFNTSYELYTQALTADPGVGAYSISASTRANVSTSYYDYIVEGMVKRYRSFRTNVERFCKKKREFHKSDGEVTEKIRKAVHSFVLNDYGNACINYYIRFGDKDRLEEAVKAFELAVKKNPQNLVAKYNLAYAYLWRREIIVDIDEVIKKLNEVVDKIPTWQAAVISSKQYKVESDTQKIRELDKEIKDKERKKQEEGESKIKIEEEINKALDSFIEISMNDGIEEIGGKTEKRIEGFSGKIPKDYDFDKELKKELSSKRLRQGIEITKSEGIEGILKNKAINQFEISHILISKYNEIEKKKMELEKYKKRVIELEKDLNDLKDRQDAIKEQRKTNSISALTEILKGTKLSAFSEGKGLNIDFDGSGVEEFLGCKKIKWERLDEHDVNALRVWANFLSYNEKKESALEASNRLFEHIIDEYYPAGNFDVNYARCQALSHLSLEKEESVQDKKTDVNKKEYMKDIKELIKKIKNMIDRIINMRMRKIERDMEETERNMRKIIKNWLEQDPIHFNALNWSFGFLKPEDQIKFFTKAVDAEPENHVLWNMLGKVYFNGDDFEESISPYKKAIKIKKDIGLYHSNLANTYKNLREWTEAAAEYKKAIKFEPLKEEYKKSLSLVLNDEGNECYDKKDYQKASEKYEEAIKYDPNDAIIYSNLSYALEKIEDPGKEAENLDKAIEALKKARELGLEALEYDKRYTMLERKKLYGKIADKLPLVTPITVEVARDLIPLIAGTREGGLSDELEKNIKELRKEILNNFGVEIPGVRFRDKETYLPDGTYIIILNEIPLVSGNISLEKKFFPGPLKKLNSLDIPGKETAVDPVTGSQGSWIEKKYWEKIKANGPELWEIIKYPVRHLQAVLQNNLSAFVGHQEVINIFKKSDIEKDHLDEIMRDSAVKLTALTRVFKGLLNEKVPIRPLDCIFNKFYELNAAHENELKILEAIRSLDEIRPLLPGNQEKYSFFQAGQYFSELIKQSIYRETPKPFLAMELHNCQEALTAVRNKVGSEQDVAILVEDPEIRPFLRKLIELEFPNVPVLSRLELLKKFKNKINEDRKIELEKQISSGKHEPLEKTGSKIHEEDVPKKNILSPEKPVIKVFVNNKFEKIQSSADNQPMKQLFDSVRENLFHELGITLPEIIIEIDEKLKVNEFRFKCNNVNYKAEYGLEPGQVLVNETADRLFQLCNIKGEKKLLNPESGRECAVVSDKDNALEKCKKAGVQALGPRGFVALSLTSKIRKNAGIFLTEEVVKGNLDLVSKSLPDLVDIFTKRRPDIKKLTLVLRELLEEEISIRDLRGILESLLAVNGTIDARILNKYIVFPAHSDSVCPVRGGKNLDDLDIGDYETCVRMSMKNYISYKYTRVEATLIVYLLDRDIEMRISEMERGDAEHERLIKAISSEVKKLPGEVAYLPAHQLPVILTMVTIRRKLKKLIENNKDLPDLDVLAYEELSPVTNIQPIARISWK